MGARARIALHCSFPSSLLLDEYIQCVSCALDGLARAPRPALYNFLWRHTTACPPRRTRLSPTHAVPRMLYECQLCGADAAVPCPRGCGAVFFCCEAHARHYTAHGHDEETCARMAAQVALCDSLRAELPFPWATRTVLAVEEGTSTLCDALAGLGIHNAGPFRRECACGAAGPFGLLRPVGLGVTPDPGAAREELRLAPPQDWREYYALRGLPLESPDALWLDTSLTLVHALVLTGGVQRRHVTVHVVGPRRELDQLAAFWEVLRFLPDQDSTLSLVLCGPDLPQSRHGARHASPCGRLSVQLVHCTAYDSHVRCSLPPPTLIFAPNAGIMAYPLEWQRTAQAVLAARPPVPMCVTDFTHEAMRTAEVLLQRTGLHVSHATRLNPFRKPACARGRESALPSYSNGWLAVLQGDVDARVV